MPSDRRANVRGMNARSVDLGYRRAGARVSVEISAPARVRLMAPEELLIQRLGGPTLCVGGTFRGGHVTLTIPEDGHWLHVVDVEDIIGAAVRVSKVQIHRRQRRQGVPFVAARLSEIQRASSSRRPGTTKPPPQRGLLAMGGLGLEPRTPRL